jgi:hypothetical protein
MLLVLPLDVLQLIILLWLTGSEHVVLYFVCKRLNALLRSYDKSGLFHGFRPSLYLPKRLAYATHFRHIARAAARGGYLELVKWHMFFLNFKVKNSSDMCVDAGRSGSISLIKWLKTHVCSDEYRHALISWCDGGEFPENNCLTEEELASRMVLRQVLRGAALSGKENVFEWAHSCVDILKQRYVFGDRMVLDLISSISVLRWLFEKEILPIREFYDKECLVENQWLAVVVAEHGTVEMLQFLEEKGMLWTNTNALEWARRDADSLGNANLIKHAARAGNVEMLNWLWLENNTKIDYETLPKTFNDLVGGYYSPSISWLLDHCPSLKKTEDVTAKTRDIKVFRLLLDRKFPWDIASHLQSIIYHSASGGNYVSFVEEMVEVTEFKTFVKENRQKALTIMSVFPYMPQEKAVIMYKIVMSKINRLLLPIE